MKKLRLFFRNLPRKTKITGNILLCLLLAFWIYLLIGSPADIATVYRRAARANLVDPGRILALSDAPALGYEDLVLAENGDFVMLYVRDADDNTRNQLVYRQRSRGLALLSLPLGGSKQESFRELPVFLFDAYADAHRAELTLSLPDGSESSPVLTARREQEGYFRFTLDDKTGIRKELIRRVLLLSENTMADTRSKALPAQIRLYDAADSLLAEYTLNWGA